MSRTEANDRLAELRAMPYNDYLQSPEWRERRKQALDWARNACQLCNADKALHVHHRTYDRLGAELPADLTVLCEKCHKRFHGPATNPAVWKMILDLIHSHSDLSNTVTKLFIVLDRAGMLKDMPK